MMTRIENGGGRRYASMVAYNSLKFLYVSRMSGNVNKNI